MKFHWYDSNRYFKRGQKADLLADIEFPCALLVKDSWDDMGWTTTFRLRYYTSAESFQVDEQLHILQEDQRSTVLPNSPFEVLGPNYYAIGGSIEFYEELMKLDETIWKEILESLRDVNYNEIPVDVDDLKGFKVSLLRSSEVEKLFNEPQTIFPWLIPRHAKILRFEYSKLLPGADAPHSIQFDFTPSETELNRINVLIGRNGTGKTQILADFANAMSGLKQEDIGIFAPTRPSFNRVVAISYGAFDNFSRPVPDSKTLSYKYCGIWEEDYLMDLSGVHAKYRDALNEVISIQRFDNLKSILSELLDDTVDYDSLYNPSSEKFYESFASLSSGQSILVMVLTQIAAYIRPDSIILYDEPELHLHPDAINGLLRAFHTLLELFDSYSIIATHSPILLQEVPSKYVRILRRFGNTPSVTNLGVESFGENLTNITEDVFESKSKENNFKTYLKKLITEGFDAEKINEFFEDRLSLNARAFLLSIEREDDEGV